ncbi:MAG: MBL fold metallo-hydrolase [Burkholderiales bacterium]|nr:MBL fold metallo-hydrolase [Burkholderiales bacterium]
MPRLSVLGAAGTVTGSKYLIEHRGLRVLVDCGLFQGLKSLRLMNWAAPPVDPRSLDAVILTHAHLDHSGYLPALVRDGFAGPVWCTHATSELCGLLLPDSGHLQEEDAEYANRKGFSKHHPALPLYTEEDARRALKRLRTVRFGEDLPLGQGAAARLTHAGHILGASSVRLALDGASVLFSGDLGRYDDLLMRDPADPPAADTLVIESTYGDRLHAGDDPSEALAAIVRRTVARGGTVLMPAFAVGRAQLLLHVIARLKARDAIPDVPVFLNSPMAVDTTELYRRFPKGHRLDDTELQAMATVATMVRDVEASKALVRSRFPSIVISASGMATGGRVLHHLKALGPDARNAIVLAGYQAAGTRGADLQAGRRTLRIHGADHEIRAEVATLHGLSAHADADDLLRWARAMPAAPRRVLVTHGEPAAAQALAARLHEALGWRTEVPAMGDTTDLA